MAEGEEEDERHEREQSADRASGKHRSGAFTPSNPCGPFVALAPQLYSSGPVDRGHAGSHRCDGLRAQVVGRRVEGWPRSCYVAHVGLHPVPRFRQRLLPRREKESPSKLAGVAARRCLSRPLLLGDSRKAGCVCMPVRRAQTPPPPPPACQRWRDVSLGGRAAAWRQARHRRNDGGGVAQPSLLGRVAGSAAALAPRGRVVVEQAGKGRAWGRRPAPGELRAAWLRSPAGSSRAQGWSRASLLTGERERDRQRLLCSAWKQAGRLLELCSATLDRSREATSHRRWLAWGSSRCNLRTRAVGHCPCPLSRSPSLSTREVRLFLSAAVVNASVGSHVRRGASVSGCVYCVAKMTADERRNTVRQERSHSEPRPARCTGGAGRWRSSFPAVYERGPEARV